MDPCITQQQLGLVFTFLGTVVLAVSLRTKNQYEGEIAKAVEKMRKTQLRLFVPTEAYIARPLFYGGLALIALGTLLQL